MALIWSKKVAGVMYEVRCAGYSLRLYSNGVFHTQYNSKRLLTGQVWDLLFLPAFFYPENKIKRILLLGVAGGAVMHMLQQFIKPQKIIGIELNPVHIYVGKKYFNLNSTCFEIIEADAIHWLKNYKGEKFDIIIDDLFTEDIGQPVAAAKANRQWFSCMLKHLAKDGLIVKNFIDKSALLDSAGVSNSYINEKFDSVFQLSNSLNENFVGVYARQMVTSRGLRNNLAKVPALNPRLKTSALKYSIRRIN